MRLLNHFVILVCCLLLVQAKSPAKNETAKKDTSESPKNTTKSTTTTNKTTTPINTSTTVPPTCTTYANDQEEYCPATSKPLTTSTDVQYNTSTENQCEAPPPSANQTLIYTGDYIEKPCPVSLHDTSETHVKGSIEGVPVCKSGFYKHPIDEKCVLIQDCPSDVCCGENEVLTRLIYPAHMVVQGQPLYKCVCGPGYELDRSSKCVPKKPPCGPNSQRAACGTACPVTCDNYLQPRQPCALPCIPDSCVCYDGFVLNKNGVCVSPSECPGGATCPLNSEWRLCVNPDPITCDMLNRKQVHDCSKTCPSAYTCQCKIGYVQRSAIDPTCVPVDQCFTKIQQVSYKPVLYPPQYNVVQTQTRFVGYNNGIQQNVVPALVQQQNDDELNCDAPDVD